MEIYGDLYAEESRKVVDRPDDPAVMRGSTSKRNSRATILSAVTTLLEVSH